MIRSETSSDFGFGLPSAVGQPALTWEEFGTGSGRRCTCRPRPGQYESARRRGVRRAGDRPDGIVDHSSVKPTRASIAISSARSASAPSATNASLVTTSHQE